MSSSKPSDPTFRLYSAADAKTYATHRLSYSQALYDTVLKHHTKTGGDCGLLLDVGCGPGNATRDVALSFDKAIGCDPGEQMIATAKDIGGKTASGKDIKFIVSPAETLSEIEDLQEGSVDLLTAAMAAHWFDMNKFWIEAAKIIKVGGTVAIWTSASSFCHPSTPNAAEVMKICLKLERETLAPYEMPGNRVSMNMYDDLALPWQISPPVEAFAKSEYVKHEYDRGGVLSDGKTFFGGGRVEKLEDIGRGLRTASMVTRWAVANPELVATDKDIITIFIKELKDAMGGQDWVERGNGTAILLLKRV